MRQIFGLGRPRRRRRGDDVHVPAFRERAFEGLARAVRLAQPAFLLLLHRRPVGVAGGAVDAGQRGVRSAQPRRALRGLAIEMEGGLPVLLPGAHLRHQGQDERRFRIALEEVLEELPGQLLVGLAQVEPGGGIGGDELREAPQVQDGVVRALQAEEGLGQQRSRLHVVGLRAQRALQRRHRRLVALQAHVGGAQEQAGRQGVRLEAKDGLELGNGLLVLAGEVQRHPEVQQEPGRAGTRADQLPVHGHRLRVPSGRHQLLAALALRGQAALVGAGGRPLARDGQQGDDEEEGRSHSRW